MGKSSPPPPRPPDYAAQAREQGAANVDTAITQGYLNNPNISGPLGGQTITFNQVGGTPDITAYNNAITNWNKSNKSTPAPTQAGFMTGGRTQPTVTQTLTPDALANLKNQQRVESGLSNLGLKALDQAGGIIGQPFKPDVSDLQTQISGIPGMTQAGPYGDAANYAERGAMADSPYAGMYGLAGGMGGRGQRLQTGYDPSGDIRGQFGYDRAYGGGYDLPDIQSTLNGDAGAVSGGVGGGLYGLAGGNIARPQIQGQIDTSQVARAPISPGTTGMEAIMSRLEPSQQRQEAMLRQRMANQGLVAGGEAYGAEMGQLQQQQTDARMQAALQGINLDAAARAQGFGEAQQMGQFANQAALSGQGADIQSQQLANQAVGQNFGQYLQAQQAQNAAQQQRFGQAVQAGQFGNDAQMAAFNASLQGGQFGNQTAAQNFGQSLQAQQAFNAAQQQQNAQSQQRAEFANAARQNQFGMGVQGQGLQNQAIAQNFGQAQVANDTWNQSQQQAFAQQMAQDQARNQAVGQNQQMNLAAVGQQNAMQGQLYNQALQSAQFGNTAQQQQLAQQMMLYQQPLNAITALMSGSQMQMPQFGGYAGSNIAPPPIMQAAQLQNQAAMDAYGIKNGNANAANSSSMGLVGAGLSAAAVAF